MYVVLVIGAAIMQCQKCAFCASTGALEKEDGRDVHMFVWEEAQIATTSKCMVVAAVSVGHAFYCN